MLLADAFKLLPPDDGFQLPTPDDGNFELPPPDDNFDLPPPDNGFTLPPEDEPLHPNHRADDDDGARAKKQRVTKHVCQHPYTEQILRKAEVPKYSLKELRMQYAITNAQQDDIMEVFSPPRLVPASRARGLIANLSIDVLCGWDLTQPQIRNFAMQQIRARRPRVLLVSPPCTVFSSLQHLNKGKVSEEDFKLRFAEGEDLLKVAVDMCVLQLQARPPRAFIFEHPLAASSWQHPSVKHVAERAGIYCPHFDQCRFGLASKMLRSPMKKPTTLMTNMRSVYLAFNGQRCLGGHTHQVIMGNEGGMKRSSHAACYPELMVQALVQASIDHLGKGNA